MKFHIDLDSVCDIYAPLIFLEIKQPIKILYGSRDSAKSTAIAQALLNKCIVSHYFKCILAREHFNSIRRSQWSKLQSVAQDWGIAHLFEFKKSPLSIICKLNGNTFIAAGLTNVNDIKSTDDPTDIWYEEAEGIDYKKYETVQLSLRSSKVEMVEEWHSFNPDNPYTFYLKEFFPPLESFERIDGRFHEVKSTRSDTYILHTTVRDNDFLTQQRLDRFKRLKYSKSSNFKVVGLGLFSKQLRGKVYNDWKIIDNFPSNCDEIFYGLDWGYSNPFTVVRIGIKDKVNAYFQQIIYKEGLTNPMALEILAVFELTVNDEIYADSAEPKSIKEFKEAGYNIKGANKEVIEGIKTVSSFNCHITSDSTDMIKEYNSYVWKTTNRGETLLDTPVKFDDHSLDAVRYGMHTRYGGVDLTTGMAFNSYYLTFRDIAIKPIIIEPKAEQYCVIKFDTRGWFNMLRSQVVGNEIQHLYTSTEFGDISGTTLFVYYAKGETNKIIFRQQLQSLIKKGGYERLEVVYMQKKTLIVKQEVDKIYAGEHEYKVFIDPSCTELISDKKRLQRGDDGGKLRSENLGNPSDLEDVLFTKLLYL